MLAQIGLLTVGVVLFAIIGGLALDRALETKPLFTALLVVGSFPFTFYIIYRVAMQAVAKIPAPPRGAPRAKEVADRDDDR
jgi:F0F1-type ATP synthase assembly protein I